MPRRPIVPTAAVLAAVAAIATGCGSSSTETSGSGGGQHGGAGATSSGAPPGARPVSCAAAGLQSHGIRVVGASCERARRTVAAWRRDGRCTSPAGASRFSCRVEGLVCLGASTARGIGVDCSGPDVSIAFVARHGA